MDSMKQQISGVNLRGNTVQKAMQNVNTNVDEFIDDNANMGDDEYEFASVGQGNLGRTEQEGM